MKILAKNHSGQVALVMVLIMTVISAVAVSVASRSTVETRVQQMESESMSALFAASTGLEKATGAETALSGSLEEGKSFAVTVNTEGTVGVLSEQMNPGETIDINLDGATSITGARVYWRPAILTDTPSIFVSEIRDSAIYDYAFDTTGTQGFVRATNGGSLNGVSFTYVTPSTINVAVGVSRSLRIKVLGAPAFVGVEPVGGEFAAQTRNYRSVGNVGGGDYTVKYGIEYKESATDQIPSVFDYALFANGSIIQ